MAIYVVEDLIKAIERCEQAAFTFFNVASSPRDYVASEHYDIPTLAKRINMALNANRDIVQGIDGKNVTNIEITENGLKIDYEFNGELSSSFYPNIVQAIPHSVEKLNINLSGELEETANGTVAVKGVVLGYDANRPQSITVNADGTMTILYTDGTSNTFGELDNFGENPVEDVLVIDGDLFMVRNGEQTRVGQIRGPIGKSGLEVTGVAVEQVVNTYYLKATLSNGYTMTCGALPEELYSPNADQPLIVSISEEGELTVTFYNNETAVIGNINSPIDGGTGVVVETFEFVDGGTNLTFKLTGSDESIVVGSPKQVAINANSKISNAYINDENQLVFDIDIDGDTLNVISIVMGEVRRYGKSIKEITIGANGDINMTYYDGDKNVQSVLGNIKYNRPKSAYRDEFGFTTIENEKGEPIVAGSADGLNGEAGKFVRSAEFDTELEYMMSFTFSDDTTAPDIGKIRPLQTHDVSVVDGELIFTLVNGTSVNLGRVSGLDGRDITGAGLIDNQIHVEYNNLTEEVVTGEINTIATISYDDTSGQIIFDYSDLTSQSVEHIRYDAVDGKWVTALAVTDGNLVITYNDLTTETVGKADGEWITGFTRVGNDLYVKWDHLDTDTLVGNIPDYDGVNAKYITAMNKTIHGDLEVIWEDASKENLGHIDGRWITKLYRTGDEFFVQFSDETVETLIGSINEFDGNAPRWITSLAPNELNDLTAIFNDGEVVSLGQINGEDGVWITNIDVLGDEVTFTMSDTTTIKRVVPSLEAKDGNIIKSMTITPERTLDIAYIDDTVKNLGHIDYQNGINNIQYVDGYIKVTNLVDGVEQETTVLPVDRILDGRLDDTELMITTYVGDHHVGRAAGVDVDDGVYITKTFIRDGSLIAAMSDDTEINAGLIESNNISSVNVVPNTTQGLYDLQILMDSGVEYRFENVVGQPNNENVVDSYIDIDGTLVLTRSSLDIVRTGQVKGNVGVGLKKLSIDPQGFLVATLTDDSSARVTYIMRSFGFSKWEPGKTYNRNTTVVFEGRAYAALSNGVDSVPSDINPDWMPIRFSDEAGPEAARPIIVSPTDGTITNTLRPILDGGPARPYYSVDHRVNRIFEIDVMDGNFNPPLYSAEENADIHQAEIELVVGTDYQWRVRDYLNTGSFSDWRFSESFQVSDNGVGTPTVSVVGEDPMAVDEIIVLRSSPFVGTGTHTKTSWQVKRNDTDEVIFEDIDSLELVEKLVPFGYLIEDKEHSIRVRHEDDLGNKSSWSNWVKIKTIPLFKLSLTPTISYVGDDINKTVAKPKFVAELPLPDIYERYMKLTGFTCSWVIEKFDGVNWTPVLTDENMVDVLEYRPLEMMESAKTHRVRVKYSSSRFATESSWSNWVEFTPVYEVMRPGISYSGSITAASAEELFDSSFAATNDTFRYSEWKFTNTNNGVVIHTDISHSEILEKTFTSKDSFMNYTVTVKHHGEFSSSEWSLPLNITVGEISKREFGVFFSNQTVDVFDHLGNSLLDSPIRTLGAHNIFSDVAVGLDDNVYVSHYRTLRAYSRDGAMLWEFDTVEEIYNVVVDYNGDVVLTTYPDIWKISAGGELIWKTPMTVGGGAAAVTVDAHNNIFGTYQYVYAVSETGGILNSSASDDLTSYRLMLNQFGNYLVHSDSSRGYVSIMHDVTNPSIFLKFSSDLIVNGMDWYEDNFYLLGTTGVVKKFDRNGIELASLQTPNTSGALSITDMGDVVVFNGNDMHVLDLDLTEVKFSIRVSDGVALRSSSFRNQKLPKVNVNMSWETVHTPIVTLEDDAKLQVVDSAATSPVIVSKN